MGTYAAERNLFNEGVKKQEPAPNSGVEINAKPTSPQRYSQQELVRASFWHGEPSEMNLPPAAQPRKESGEPKLTARELRK